MKTFLLIGLLLTLGLPKGFAQNSTKVKYYDSSWNESSIDSAYYLTEYLKVDTKYKEISYRVKSRNVYSIDFYSDSALKNQIGPSTKYYEDGQLEDSCFYNDENEITSSFHYYTNGNIWARYSYDSENDKKITEAYEIDGKPIKGFIYFREAEFPGGPSEWQNFLSEKIKTNIPIKKGAPIGKHKVIIRFTVNEKGELIDIRPETNLGYGMEEEVCRVIRKSPKWIPAIWLDKTKKGYRQQPITFWVE